MSDLIFLESDDELENATDHDGEFDDGFSEESDSDNAITRNSQGIYPSLLESFDPCQDSYSSNISNITNNIAHSSNGNSVTTNNASNSHNNSNASNKGVVVLPDILNFTSSFANSEAKSSISSSNSNSTVQSTDNEDLILVNFLLDEGSSGNSKQIKPDIPPKPKTRAKPDTGRKPNETSNQKRDKAIATSCKIDIDNDIGSIVNNTATLRKTKNKNSNNIKNNDSSNDANDSYNSNADTYESFNLIQLDHIYDVVERPTNLPVIPPRPNNPPVIAKRPESLSLDTIAVSPLSMSSDGSLDSFNAPGEIFMADLKTPRKVSSTTKTFADAEPSTLQNTSTIESKSSYYVCMYDFQGADASYLSLKSGQKLKLVEKTNEDWWWGEIGASCEGYFPSQYVLEMSHYEQQVIRVLYDFDSEHHVELTVFEGDVGLLLEERDDWLKILTKNGEGLVPFSYAQIL